MKFVVYFFFSKIIFFSIFFQKCIKKNLLYTNEFGFGDYVLYCCDIRRKLNHKTKIFCFSELQNEIASFFFEKKHIINSFILLPRFLNESHLGYHFLIKKDFFKPTIFTKLVGKNIRLIGSDACNLSKNPIQFMKKKVNSAKISSAVIEILKKPTLCLYIKNFSKYSNNNNNINFQVRQTRNLNKIKRLLHFLSTKKINVIILGKNKDHFIQLLPNSIKKGKFKNIFLLKDLSNDYSINDQAYVALNSIGYIGSGSGANVFFGLCNKITIVIDFVFSSSDKYRTKNLIFLYKMIYDKKNKVLEKFKWSDSYNKKKHRIIETEFLDIKKTLINKILKAY
tara:strand:- start:575 stop:1588 length:1014 start_codon:yes stop_codon:yes gene_type:complete